MNDAIKVFKTPKHRYLKCISEKSIIQRLSQFDLICLPTELLISVSIDVHLNQYPYTFFQVRSQPHNIKEHKQRPLQQKCTL